MLTHAPRAHTVFGRTSTRLRDPSMVTHEEINGDCALWCGINSFTGCGWMCVLPSLSTYA